jgi:photosystem II stability/assembly factor-like uncharacterized protein
MGAIGRGVTNKFAIAIITAATAITGVVFPAAASASGGPPPGKFIANSTSWISPSTGWVLGQVSCGKNKVCSQVRQTVNGGKTWLIVGKIPAPIPKIGNPGAGITEIRFATAEIGWAFTPDLYLTTDGGKSWKKTALPGDGKQVLDLATTAASVYLVVSPCAYETGICTSKPLTAWRALNAKPTWTQMKTPKLHINVSANVSALGNTVYVVNSNLDGPNHPSQLFASTDGGKTFTARPIPCTAEEEKTLIQAVPYSPTKVGLLCDGNPGFSKAVKAVYLSADNGKTDKFDGIMGLFGIQAGLAISPTGKLAVESWSDGSFIYINDNNKAKWYMVIGSGDGGAGFNDITYVSPTTAFVVFGPADMFSGYGQLYATHDAGRHWALVKF